VQASNRNDEVIGIARAFVDARNSGTGLARYPGTPPASLSQAYAVQDAALSLADPSVAGWKVGRINPPIDGQDRLAGPIFAATVAHDGASMPVFADGFAAAEAEFMLRIARTPDPAKVRYTMDEARDMIDAVHVGIEVASSPYPGINIDGPLVTISDFGNTHGHVLGAELPDWRARDLNAIPVALSIGGVEAGAATTATMLDGPFGAVRFLLEHLAGRGIPLAAGQWVSTGAVTGVHPVAVGDAIEARFGDDLTIRCTIAAR
jgi:2-keto-4-pentenoate hydratase